MAGTGMASGILKHRPLRTGFALLMAFLVPASTATTVGGDAGSGLDAGNSPETALQLPNAGAYSGSLPPSDPADWYKLKWSSSASRPGCVEIGATTDRLLHGTFAILAKSDQVVEVGFVARPVGTSTAGIAGASIKGTAYALYSPVASTLASYGFGISAVLPSQFGASGDAGSGGDARSAAPLGVDGGCVTGAVGGADASDAYGLALAAGETIVLTLTGATTRVDVLSPSQQLVASLVPGDVLQYTAATAGSYTLSTSASSPTSYAIGICDISCGPPERPCDPMCALILGDG